MTQGCSSRVRSAKSTSRAKVDQDCYVFQCGDNKVLVAETREMSELLQNHPQLYEESIKMKIPQIKFKAFKFDKVAIN